MRASSILSEAWRNLTTGTTRAALFGLALATMCGTLAVADARSVVTLEQRAAEFIAAGASVRVLSAEGNVDGAACEALNGVPGIDGAGALREREAFRLDAMPANPLPAYTVTPEMAGLLGVSTVTAEGVWLSEDTASTLEAVPGQSLAATEGTLTVAGTFPYPDDGRDVRPGYAALVPEADTEPFDECWVWVWPPSEQTEELLHSAVAVSAPPDTPITVGQLNASLGETFDGAAEFDDRATRFALPAAALAGVLLGFVSVRLRRLEFASALHVGQSRRSQLACVLVETAVWSVAGLVLSGCALVVAAHLGNPGDPGDVLGVGAPGLVAAVPAALAGAVLALVRIREEHLFRYFKER